MLRVAKLILTKSKTVIRFWKDINLSYIIAQINNIDDGD